jgi:hypothetical protein
VSGELGLRSYLEKLGHELIVTSDKDSANSEFDKHLPDAEVVISSLSAPARYAAGTLEILQSFYEGIPIREEYLIVDGGALAGTGARSYQLT